MEVVTKLSRTSWEPKTSQTQQRALLSSNQCFHIHPAGHLYRASCLGLTLINNTLTNQQKTNSTVWGSAQYNLKALMLPGITE